MNHIRKYRQAYLTAIISLSLSLLCFYAVQIKLEQKKIRSEVKLKILQGIDRSELVYIPSTIENELKFEWEHDSEFRFNGRMYDVVEIEDEKGKKGYWCWLDDKESAQEEKLDRLISLMLGENPLHSDKQNSINRFVKSLHYQTIDNQLQLSVSEINRKNNNHNFIFITKLKSPPPFPPPEFC